VSERVFMINNINIDTEYLIKLCDILDLGMKFIPTTFEKHIYFLKFFLNNLDCSLYNFNKFLFYSKMSLKNKNCTRTEKGTYNKTFIHYLNQFNSKSIKNENEIELQHETLSLRKIMIKTLSKAFQ